MNSETVAELNRQVLQDNLKTTIQQEQIVNARLKIVREGAEAEDFMAQPHWQQLLKDGEALEKKLYQELLKPDYPLTKVRAIQSEIKLLKWLLDNPRGYLEKRNLELTKGRK